jgi:two-component system sensor histidine kinase/response regulator
MSSVFKLKKKGLEFLFQIDPRVSRDLIGDPLRLGQVLMNLAGNAVKFTDRGEIVISVALEERLHDAVILRFSVRDSGIGLQKEQTDLLFSAFRQADDSITRRYGGTGLGLAISKQLTELMGGKIWVESGPGKGSIFSFTAKLRLLKETREEPKSVEFLRGLRALVVDDNESARDVLSAMLASFQIKVDTAVDGKSALVSLEEARRQGSPYDMVLLDWIMPGIDGIETARQIKANALLAKVSAMLMVTANGREEVYTEAEKVGLDGFLLKPVYASVMYNTLLDILGIETLPGPLTVRDRARLADLTAIQGAHILLVDDNTINQEVATEFLEDAGMVVTVASSGRECLEALHHSHYDLVLMDIQMPDMDGLEATRRIRRDSGFKDLPIIAMTAHAMAGDREKSLAAGMDDHITKPIDQAVLCQTLKKWIGGEQTASPQQKPHAPSSVSATGLALPSLPGIDQAEALKVLNKNTRLFVKLLYDFRKNFSSLPPLLRNLSEAGRWPEIQEKAHTVKGVAGYLGASGLMEAAQKLEIALKNNRREEATNHLVSLINALDTVLSSLAALPAQEEAAPGRDKRSPERDIDGDIVGEEAEKSRQVLVGRLGIETEDPLQLLIASLKKGELIAEERLAEVTVRLADTGLDEHLKTIAALIDDIEYEKAAEVAGNLLAMIQQGREN